MVVRSDPTVRPVVLFQWLLAAVAACGMAALSACSAPARPLRVGANSFPGYEALFLARDKGYFGKSRIELLEFPSTTEVIRAYRNGTIDVAAMTADEALLAAEEGVPDHVVLVTDASAGTDAILARPEYGSMQALRGRRIGVETGALGSLVLSRALELSGLSPDDVTVVPLTVDAHESAYRQRLVDAVVTFDPTSSRLQDLGAVRIFDSTRIPHEIFDVLVTPENVALDRKKDLVALGRGWFRAQAFLASHPDEAIAHMAARSGQLSPEAFREALGRLEVPDRAKSLQWLGEGPGSLAAPLRGLADFMVRKELLPHRTAPRLVLDDRIVQDAGP